jgi:hypothetical protein
MAFDTKSPTPKVLFSPAGATPDADLEAVLRQSKSAAAEAAVKLSVFQAEPESETEADQFVQASTVEADESFAEPVLRESSSPQADKSDDVSDIVKKWAKK